MSQPPSNPTTPPSQPSPAQYYPPTPYAPPVYAYEEEEINLLDYWRVLMKRKWQIIIVTLLCSVLAVSITIIMPKKYTSEVTLMPVTSKSGGGSGLGAVAAQLSSIPLLGGQLGGMASKLSGGKSKELVNILKSRTMTESLISRFDLMRILFAKQWDPQTETFRPNFLGDTPVLEDAVKKFQKKVAGVKSDKKSGLVKIKVTMKNPQLAAIVANGMVVELHDFISNNSLTVEKRNRIFIEAQMVKNRAKLLEAGKELDQFYEQNKISSVIPQLDVNVGSYESSPKTFEEFREELASLGQAQSQVQKNKKETSYVTKVPGQVYLEYLTLNRQLLGKSHALLTQQYELSKIEEAKEDLAFQVIDKARVMVRPSSPIIWFNLLIGFLGGFFLATFIALFQGYLQKLREKEAN